MSEQSDAVVEVNGPLERDMRPGDIAAEKLGPMLYPELPRKLAILKAKAVGVACTAEAWDADLCKEQQQAAERVFDYLMMVMTPQVATPRQREPRDTAAIEDAMRKARYASSTGASTEAQEQAR